MVTDKVKELAEIEARALELRKAIAQERAKELASLPAQYGFGSVREFIAALKDLDGGKEKKISKEAAPKGRKKRAKLTPELKDSIVKALKDGKPGSAVATEFGVSPASVNLIKKAAGLTKPRK
jgi:hypothetical protein